MNILKYLLIACSCLIGAAHAQSPIAKDTIEYRAQVWVDKTDLERYGGEEDFKKNLKKMFLCCSWRWVQRMKGFPVGEVERVGNL